VVERRLQGRNSRKALKNRWRVREGG